MLFRHPTGKWVLVICTNVSCALLGARRLFERALEVLGPEAEEHTTDGLFTVHEEECLGACDQAPLVQVNFFNYARMDEARLEELLPRLRAGDPPASTQGPVPPDFRAACRLLAGLGVAEFAAASSEGAGSG
jgi:NADH-quinone oxidoreductase subunit E